MSDHVRRSDVFIVVPAFNEEQVIPGVLKNLVQLNYSVIVVDDGSTNQLLPFIASIPVYYLRHRINLGQGAALQTGIEWALEKNAYYIVTFDADGQHDPKDIERLLQPLFNNETDIVLGSRFLRPSQHIVPPVRKLLLKMAIFVNFIFAGMFLSDAHNGLRGMNRKAAQKIRLAENKMAHATEFLSQIRRNKLRVCEVPVSVRYTNYSRNKGQTSSASFRILFDLFLNKLFK